MDKIGIELWVSIGINLLALAFFAGVFTTTQKQLKENVALLKDEFTKKFDEMKKEFSEKIRDLKENFHEKIDSLERKQDKHNNVIERMALVEASAKSAHHRIDTIESKI